MSRVKRAQSRARPADTSGAAVGALARTPVGEKRARPANVDDLADPTPGPPFENEG